MSNNNNNWMKNLEPVNTIIEGNSIYDIYKNGSRVFLRKVKANKVNVNVTGPGTYFKNNSKKNAALNIVRISRQNNLNRAKNKMSKNEYEKYLKGFLGMKYVAGVLSSIGEQSYRNYVAKNKNGYLRGFAVVYNSPVRTTERTIKLIATIPRKGTGKHIINKIKHNAKQNGKSRLVLEAVKSAVPFYNKIGFRRTRNINTNNKIIPMYMNI